MKKIFNEGNQIYSFMSSFGSGTVINYGSGSGSDFLTSYGSGYVSGSTSQKVTVPTVPVPVPVPQHCRTHYTVHTISCLLLSFTAESLASGPQSGKAPHHSLPLPHLVYTYHW